MNGAASEKAADPKTGHVEAVKAFAASVANRVADGAESIRRLWTGEPRNFGDVFNDELVAIRARRKDRALEDSGLPDFGDSHGALKKALKIQEGHDDAWCLAASSDESPFRHDGLVGLGLSGGGIRSATFNLGVLQSLHQLGIFRKIDYLSTVSGGGYIGSCLASLAASGQATFPFEHALGTVENQRFKHLREYSNYLAPHGLKDRLRLPALFIWGLFLNFVLVIPFVIAAAALFAWTVHSHPAIDQMLRANFFSLWMVVILAGLFAFVPMLKRMSNSPGILFGSVFLLIFISVLAKNFGFAETIVVDHPVWKHFLVAAILLLFVGGAHVASLRQNQAWAMREAFTRFLGFYLGAIFLVFFIELQTHAIDFYNAATRIQSQSWRWLLANGLDVATALMGVATFVAAFFAAKGIVREQKVRRSASLFMVAILCPLFIWFLFLVLAKWALHPASGQIEQYVFDLAPAKLKAYGDETFSRVVWYAILVAGIYAIGLFVNVNDHSLHGFYRDRLSKAFLLGAAQDTVRPPHNDSQLLSTCGTGAPSWMPYHIVNAAINITKSTKEDDAKTIRRPGRTAESFFFTRDHSGSDATGFCRTSNLEKSDPWLNLGTAMAISGAAFAPNMGNVTLRPLVFLLTMLNVRLCYWLINPRLVVSGIGQARTKIKVPGRYLLFMESLATLSATDDFVNLSDGGHMDNLGLYELLRRRCRLIIASDAEADPNYEFQGLVTICRLAQIDMGIEVQFHERDLNDIRSGKAQFALGRVLYSDSVEGTIIYLKASLRDSDIPIYVDRYKKSYPEFPHQTTMDQFYDEEQFECYRALGYAVARTVFENVTHPGSASVQPRTSTLSP